MSIFSRSFSSRIPASLRMRRSSVMSSLGSAMVPSETAPVRLKPAPRSRSVVATVRYVRNDYRTSVAAMDHGREPKSLGEPVYRRDVHPGRYRVGDHRRLGPGERPRGTGELHARTRIVPDRGRRRRGQLVHHGPPFVPSHRRRRNRDERLVLQPHRGHAGVAAHRVAEHRRVDPPHRWRNRRGRGIPPDDVGRLPGRRGVAADGQRRGWPERRLRPYEHPEPDRRPACRPYGSRVVGLPHRRDWSHVGLDGRPTKIFRIGIEGNHRLVRQRRERGDTAPVTPRSCQLRAALQTRADTEETPHPPPRYAPHTGQRQLTNHAAYTPKKTTPQITSSANGGGLEGPLTKKATMPARATMGKRAIRTSARRKIARNRCRADRSPPWRTVPFDPACAASVSFALLRASCSRSSSIARTRLARDLEVG